MVDVLAWVLVAVVKETMDAMALVLVILLLAVAVEEEMMDVSASK